MLMLAILLGAAADDAAVIERYRMMTAAERRCVVDPDSTDITVCGMRHADRFRVPFVGPEPGDREFQDVRAERERLFHRRTPVQDMGPFLVGGGFAGVTAGTRGGFQTGAVRKTAP